MSDETKTLADKCFEAQLDDDALFKAVHYILGGKDISLCNLPDFVFPCDDVSCDAYDSSIEVSMDLRVPPMTREQVNAILALGFGQIYESQGDVGRQWTKDHVWPCSVRAGDDRSPLMRTREALTTLRANLEALAERFEFTGARFSASDLRRVLAGDTPPKPEESWGQWEVKQ